MIRREEASNMQQKPSILTKTNHSRTAPEVQPIIACADGYAMHVDNVLTDVNIDDKSLGFIGH